MTDAPQTLPTVPGPLRPIGPLLERELALILERTGDPAELAASVIGWAFETGLVVRAAAPDIAHVIVMRDGTSRAARVVAAPPAPPPARAPSRPSSRGGEWTNAMPARRRRS